MAKINKDFFDDIIKYLNKQLILDIFIIMRNYDKSYSFKKPDVDNEVQNIFKKKITIKFVKFYKNLKKKRFAEYSEESRSGDILYLEKSEIPKKELIVKEMEPIEEIRSFSELTRNIWGFILNFKDAEDGFFRIFYKYRKSQFLRGSKKHILSFTNGKLQFFDKDLLNYDFSIHSFYYNEKLVMFNKYYTEQLFNFQEMFRQKAIQTLKEIEKLPFKIENFDYLKTKCTNNPTMTRKIANIHGKKYYENIEFGDIQKTVEDYNLEIELDEKTQTINIPKFQNIWDFLHILDDAYLRSEMTQNRYETYVKKEK